MVRAHLCSWIDNFSRLVEWAESSNIQFLREEGYALLVETTEMQRLLFTHHSEHILSYHIIRHVKCCRNWNEGQVSLKVFGMCCITRDRFVILSRLPHRGVISRPPQPGPPLNTPLKLASRNHFQFRGQRGRGNWRGRGASEDSPRGRGNRVGNFTSGQSDTKPSNVRSTHCMPFPIALSTFLTNLIDWTVLSLPLVGSNNRNTIPAQLEL